MSKNRRAFFEKRARLNGTSKTSTPDPLHPPPLGLGEENDPSQTLIKRPKLTHEGNKIPVDPATRQTTPPTDIQKTAASTRQTSSITASAASTIQTPTPSLPAPSEQQKAFLAPRTPVPETDVTAPSRDTASIAITAPTVSHPQTSNTALVYSASAPATVSQIEASTTRLPNPAFGASTSTQTRLSTTLFPEPASTSSHQVSTAPPPNPTSNISDISLPPPEGDTSTSASLSDPVHTSKSTTSLLNQVTNSSTAFRLQIPITPILHSNSSSAQTSATRRVEPEFITCRLSLPNPLLNTSTAQTSAMGRIEPESITYDLSLPNPLFNASAATPSNTNTSLSNPNIQTISASSFQTSTTTPADPMSSASITSQLQKPNAPPLNPVSSQPISSSSTAKPTQKPGASSTSALPQIESTDPIQITLLTTQVDTLTAQVKLLDEMTAMLRRAALTWRRRCEAHVLVSRNAIRARDEARERIRVLEGMSAARGVEES